MDYAPGGVWQIMLTERDIKDKDEFRFELLQDGKVVKQEWRGHYFKAPKAQKDIIIRSRWLDTPEDAALWSPAFSKLIFDAPDEEEYAEGNICLRVSATKVRKGEALAIVGMGKALDGWSKPHRMQGTGFPWWFLSLDVNAPLEYKFVIVDAQSGEIKCWEDGPNHFLAEVPPPGVQLIVADFEPKFSREPWKGAGLAIPVFSLRSNDSFGIGEFHDLIPLADWAAECGMCIIQLLPVNDTTISHTWQDSYPYNAVSSFALHPLYIHLPDAGAPQDAAYLKKKAKLEALPQLDYEAVERAKMEILHSIFESPDAKKLLQSKEYKDFVKENGDWLIPYARFCEKRDGADSPGREFYCFVQYHLDRQLKEAVAYAHSKGIAIKGDLPIGVSASSVDVQEHPELFHLDSQAGAPPDFFAKDGQNWGFPTYNWEKMVADGYSWWRARLGKMAQYFDAFRIDHILGFFRIWEIPKPHRSGLLGHFNPALPYSEEELRKAGFKPGDGEGTDVLFLEDPYRKGYWHPRIEGYETESFALLPAPQKERFRALHEDFFWHRHNEFWREGAMEKLPALLGASGMMVCGEDLGMIPSCVAPVMKELGILSLEIQRMPKAPGEEFGRPERYSYNSVCSTGTHDTSTLRAWWEEDRESIQTYYNNVLGCEGEAPWFCDAWIASLIISAHLASPAMLAIFPLQDWLAMDDFARYGGTPADERINVPASSRHYWRFRMHCTLEKLVENEKMNARIRTMVYSSGR